MCCFDRRCGKERERRARGKREREMRGGLQCSQEVWQSYVATDVFSVLCFAV